MYQQQQRWTYVGAKRDVDSAKLGKPVPSSSSGRAVDNVLVAHIDDTIDVLVEQQPVHRKVRLKIAKKGRGAELTTQCPSSVRLKRQHHVDIIEVFEQDCDRGGVPHFRGRGHPQLHSRG